MNSATGWNRGLAGVAAIVWTVSVVGGMPLRVSGIYPHLAAFNQPEPGVQDPTHGEAGTGAIVPWAGRLWFITYPQHKTTGSNDKLYEVAPDLTLTIRPESVGGTHANRMIHRESNQLIIGPYFIDADRNVRVVDLQQLRGRMTAVMRHLTDLWISLWLRIAQEIQIDRIHIWEDMSGRQGSLVSPKMVEEFMMPCYDRIGAVGRENGVRVVSVDTDGDVSELVPIFMRHGVNLIYPFEVQAGNDILEYRRKYPDLGILGGLDKRALAKDHAAIDREIDKAREMVKHGRYIPCFDHLIPPDVPWENYKYAAEQMRDVCFKA